LLGWFTADGGPADFVHDFHHYVVVRDPDFTGRAEEGRGLLRLDATWPDTLGKPPVELATGW
jgi:hypothetical protein